ncbi:MAG: site-2 protease family protein [Actinobacteria bacterium]|nr:site-2 protease family protein [Actinomycetota bacterium]
MEESVRLGRIAGVDVGMNWSVLAIFALIAFSLSTGRFPQDYPELSTLAYAVAGFVAAVLFFLSLLAHELAHAIVAQRNGVEVEGITLWLFGGVARLTGEARDPGADLRIAGVGPLVSVAAAAIFGALYLGASRADAGIVAGVVGWLAVINLALAIFNLMPAAPLDGGRILRAFLWRRRDDRHSATVTAAKAGRVFGFLLIGLGLLQFAGGAGFDGLWLMLIGWFLTNAAKSEEQHAELQQRVGGVRVEDVMTRDPVAAPPFLSVQEFLDRYVFGYRFATFPLVEDGRPVGLLGLNRIREVPAGQRGATSARRVACPMEEVATAQPDEPLLEVLPRMQGCADGRVLVVDDDGQLVGIVSPTDVARVIQLSTLRDLRDQHV